MAKKQAKNGYNGNRLADGTPLNQAVYRAFRNGGLSHNQALAITAEVGRENGFDPKYVFGGHIDPAGAKGGGTIQNTGFLSWNGSRGANLQNYLRQVGAMVRGGMARTQEALNAQARFAINEMKSDAYRGKLKHFWNNPNANPESFARELGKNYIVWAYGQDTIRDKNGGRVPFDWKSHDNRRRGYLNALAGVMSGGENYTPQRVGTNTVLANRGDNQPSSQLLVGIMGDYRLGDTGSGSGDHYDLRARDKNGKRVNINNYLDRFFVDGKALNAYKQTGRYMEARKGYYHQGVDFGFNGSFGGKQSARQLFINPAFADQVAGVSSHFDKGSKGRSGGWYTKVTFKDGVSVNILHQNKKGMGQINQGWQAWQQNRQGQMGQGGQQTPNDGWQTGFFEKFGVSNPFTTSQMPQSAPQLQMGNDWQSGFFEKFGVANPFANQTPQPTPQTQADGGWQTGFFEKFGAVNPFGK